MLDGWWAEAFDGSNGWAFSAEPARDETVRDARDADAVFSLLERAVHPLFYERDASGVPRGWIRLVKNSLRTNGPRFCAGRMLHDYVSTVYPNR